MRVGLRRRPDGALPFSIGSNRRDGWAGVEKAHAAKSNGLKGIKIARPMERYRSDSRYVGLRQRITNPTP